MRRYYPFLLYFLCTCVSAPLLAQNAGAAAGVKGGDKGLPTIAAKTEGSDRSDGYFPTYWDAETGKLYLEISRWEEDFLYVNSLAAGLGSNDIGLDRNQLGNERVVHFRRVGPKVLLQQRNLGYRAISDNPEEARSVEEAFAQSVLYGFAAVAKTDDRYLIDLTPMLLTDAHGVAQRLKQRKQGTFKIDADRSAVYPERTKNFPQNSEFEATITFVGEATGSQLRSVAATPNSFSLRIHHSFVQLPDDNYEPRVFDPRSGYYPTSYQDYATPIDQPLVKRFITRHRLQKKDPSAAISDPVEPIIYYLDRGAPEPIKSALLEGARWWNQAFAGAGYRNAFRVEVLPEGADPLDVRYNVINWVHRSTRGWSYGSSVTDPRTGEIIKGHVLLGSLRVRQDFLLAQGLIDAYADGETPDPRLEEMALARLRQLSAHEVGHTIGLAHNFAASTNDRASVMDYPHPYVRLVDNQIDLSQAYATGIGEWDKRTVLYGYQDFPASTDERAALQEILNENDRLGLRYVSDADARPPGSAQPNAHLWDNGSSPTQELERLLELREVALKRLDENNIPVGAPLSTLEGVLAPVYLMHRYQVEAVAKQIGGYHYTYAVRAAEGSATTRPVSVERQQRALRALLQTLSPEVLQLPPTLTSLIPPPAMGYARDRELFRVRTGGGLDPLAMAEAAADNTLKFLLHPHRLNRVAEQHALYADQGYPGLDDYLDEIEDVADEYIKNGLASDLQLIVRERFYIQLMESAKHTDTGARAKREIYSLLYRKLSDDEDDPFKPRLSGNAYLGTVVARFLRGKDGLELPAAPELPDGSPIGCGGVH